MALSCFNERFNPGKVNQKPIEWKLVTQDRNQFKPVNQAADESLKKGKRVSVTQVIKKITTFLFYVGCAIGCYTQIHSVTVSYFDYASITKVSVEIPRTLDAPALSVCFRYADVMNLEEVVKRSGKNISLDDEEGLSDQDIRTIQSLVTIRDIFEFSPSGDIFNSCTIRYPNSYSFEELDGKNCSKHIKIDKFYLQEFVCYRFEFETVKGMDKYKFRNLAYALAYPGMFFSVTFNISTFLRADYVKVILNPVGIRPYRSAAFAPSFWRRFDSKSKLAKYNWFTITYGMLINKRLPPPFNTSCVDYKSKGVIDSNDCIRQCLIEGAKRSFNRYPYSVLLENHSNGSSKVQLDMKTIVVQDLIANDSVSSELFNLEQNCSSLCSSLDCEVHYSMTKVAKEPQVNIMTFQVNTPQAPTYSIEFKPKTKFIEYFIYVLSCFGTWFGLSILSLNPFRYKTFFCKKSNDDEHIFHSERNQAQRNGRALSPKFLTRSQRRINHSKLRSDPVICRYCTETSHIVMRELKQELSLITYLLEATGHRAGNNDQGRNVNGSEDQSTSLRNRGRNRGGRLQDRKKDKERKLTDSSSRRGSRRGRKITFSSRHRLPLIRVNGGGGRMIYDPTVGVPIMPLN